jgi:hypothetical protein
VASDAAYATARKNSPLSKAALKSCTVSRMRQRRRADLKREWKREPKLTA